MERKYDSAPLDCAHIMTVEEWSDAVARGDFIDSDGIGFWCKDGKESQDGVFSSQPEDATHVAWYNK